MKITNSTLLRGALALTGTLAEGILPADKCVDGVKVAPFKGDSKVAVCISADFELNWAWRSLSPANAESHGESTRRNFPLILALAREYDIPLTWATVGHLFLSECKKVNGRAHHEMPRPSRNELWDGDWYRHDPCTDAQQSPLWYAPDLIEQIANERVGHEIGTHSFSHIDFRPDCSSDELVRRELEECIRVMAPFGIKPSSLVFPFNHQRPSLDVLAGSGITAVRWRDARAVLSYPERTHSGVYKIRESMSLRAPKRYDLVDKCRIMLHKAAERRAAFHFWFHPCDDRALFENEFRRILASVAEARQTGMAWPATMREIAAYCEARDSVALRVERQANRITVTMDNSAYSGDKYGPAELTLIFPDTDQPRMARALVGARDGLVERQALVRTASGRRLIVTVPNSTDVLELVF
jgi:hypothetical protein